MQPNGLYILRVIGQMHLNTRIASLDIENLECLDCHTCTFFSRISVEQK